MVEQIKTMAEAKLGASWRTSLGGLLNIVFGTGFAALGFFSLSVPLAAVSLFALSGKSINDGIALLMTKDKQVTGINGKATSDPSKDATKK